MAGREVEVIKLEGLKELIGSLPMGVDFTTKPTHKQLDDIRSIAYGFLHLSSAALPETTVVYSVVRWASEGPTDYGILVALNPRKPLDKATSRPFLVREFSDTGQTSDRIVSWEEADEELVRYSTTQFGRPTLVK